MQPRNIIVKQNRKRLELSNCGSTVLKLLDRRGHYNVVVNKSNVAPTVIKTKR